LNITVGVPALRVAGRGAGVARVGGHEAAEGGGVVAGAEVVEAGGGVAFFASEVEGVHVAADAVEAVAEGQAGAGFISVGIISHGGAETFGTQPVGVAEGRPAADGSEMAASGKDVALNKGVIG